jgi:hypothetical protein
MMNRGRVWVAAAAALALTGLLAVSASAAPPRFQGEDAGDRGKDTRQGRRGPLRGSATRRPRAG